MDIVDQFVRWYLNGTFRQRPDEADWCRHIHWEHNLAADTHANWLMDNRVPDLQHSEKCRIYPVSCKMDGMF